MKKRFAFVFAIFTAVSLGVAIPASAEGFRGSYLSGWHGVQYDGLVPATVSKTWVDKNSDNASTRVYLFDVTANFPGTQYTYVSPKQQLQMQKSTIFGWQSLGNRTMNTGAAHNWGDLGAGTFRFQWNGASVNVGSETVSCYSNCVYVFDAESVTIWW